MSLARNIFKKVMINEDCFLYPTPVIKDQKYLLLVKARWGDFFLTALEKKWIELPDANGKLYQLIGKHTDQKTPILSMDQENLYFALLPDREQDLSKAKTIESLLSQKILAILNEQDNALEELIKTLNKQSQCSTCEKLGFLKLDQKALINLLS